jgi:hypothetical protein
MATTRWRLAVICIALSFVAPTAARAVVLCANKKGTVAARPACKRKETLVDVASLVPITTKPAVGVRVIAPSPISVPYNVNVAVPFDTVDFDTDAFFKPLSSNTTLVAPRDGIYTITANVEWDRPGSGSGPVNGWVSATIAKTASVSERSLAFALSPYQNTFAAQSLSAVVRLVAGEGIGLYLVNETGVTLNASAPDKITTLSMVWNGP